MKQDIADLKKENFEETLRELKAQVQMLLREYYQRKHDQAIRHLMRTVRQKISVQFNKPDNLLYDEWIASIDLPSESLSLEDLVHTKYGSQNGLDAFSEADLSAAVLDATLSQSKRESFSRLFLYAFGVHPI